MSKKGVIYILTNPSFKEYVKIGYATDIEKRLKTLNRSETIPFAFRVYATYDVDAELTDKELHRLIDMLNPDLRTIETFDGKTRTKEFLCHAAGRSLFPAGIHRQDQRHQQPAETDEARRP